MADIPDLDLRQLRYFRQVAQDLNFTKAARALFVAQQTLSESVAQLERLLNVKLLDRSPQRVELTEAGRVLAQRCDELLAQAEAAVAVVRAEHRKTTGVICVGTPDWPSGIELFRSAITAYSVAAAVPPSIDPIPWIEHLRAVASGRLDVGVTFTGDPADLPSGLAEHPLLTDDSGWLLVSQSHPLAGRESVTSEELRNVIVLFIQGRDHPGLHRRLARRLTELGMSAQNPNNDGAFASAAFHASVSDTAVWISASIAATPPTGTQAIRAPALSMPLRLVAITRAAEDRPEISGFIEQLRRGTRNHAGETSGG